MAATTRKAIGCAFAPACGEETFPNNLAALAEKLSPRNLALRTTISGLTTCQNRRKNGFQDKRNTTLCFANEWLVRLVIEVERMDIDDKER